jgi:uncharacterized membrane protein
VPEQNSPAARAAGLALAGVGLSHFVAPQIYEGMTKAAFPDDTRRHVYIDGVAETAIGLGIAAPATRKPALVALVGYLLYLTINTVRTK